MRRLALGLLLTLAAPLGAQTMPPDIAEIARILQTGGLLPTGPRAWDTYGPPQSRHDLLLNVAVWVQPRRAPRGEQPGFVFYTGAEPPDTLRAFLADLRASGVISARTHQRLTNQMEAGENGMAKLRLGLAQTAARLTHAEDRFRPEPLAPGLNALVASGALTPAERATVESLLKRDRIESAAELAAALPTGVLIPAASSGETPEALFRRALTATTDLLRQRQIADLTVESLEATVVSAPEAFGGSVRHDLHVCAQISGQAYQTREFFGYTDEGDAMNLTTMRVAEAVPLLNKALRDAASLYRVYAVEMDAYDDQWADTVGTVFLALTAEQAKAASAAPLALVSEYTILRADTLSTELTAAMLGLLRDAGLLEGLPQDRLDALDAAYADSPEALLETLGLLLVIDGEMDNLDTPYTSLVDDLAALSHGLFAPEAVKGTFDWDARTASLAFTLGGTQYATDLEFDGDWMDGTVLHLIDRALREASGAKLYTAVYGRFDDGRPMAGDSFMILTEPQRALVEGEGWVELLPYTEWATSPAFPDGD